MLDCLFVCLFLLFLGYAFFQNSRRFLKRFTDALSRDRNHVTTGKEVGKNQSDFRDFVRFHLKKILPLLLLLSAVLVVHGKCCL